MVSGVCANCGSSAWHVLNRRERVASWFQSGHGAAAVRCEACGASGGSGGWYRLGWQDLGPLERMRQLPRMWRHLHLARTWDPTPRFYVYVTGAALVGGGLAAAIARRRWLLVAVPTAAFLTTFAIAARPVVGRLGRDLLREFVDPMGSHRRDVARQAAALRAQQGRVPVLVPANWDGPVRLVGVGLSADVDGAVDSVVIAAEPPGREAPVPHFVLRTHTADEFEPDAAVMVVANDEHGGLGNPVEPLDRDLQVFEAPEPAPERVEELQASWRDTTLAVDGEPVAARVLAGRAVQVAVLHLDDHVIEITGYGVDLERVHLCRPNDLEPLITAFEARTLAQSA